MTSSADWYLPCAISCCTNCARSLGNSLRFIAYLHGESLCSIACIPMILEGVTAQVDTTWQKRCQRQCRLCLWLCGKITHEAITILSGARHAHNMLTRR